MLKAAYFHSRISLLVYWLRCILGNFHSSDKLFCSQTKGDVTARAMGKPHSLLLGKHNKIIVIWTNCITSEILSLDTPTKFPFYWKFLLITKGITARHSYLEVCYIWHWTGGALERSGVTDHASSIAKHSLGFRELHNPLNANWVGMALHVADGSSKVALVLPVLTTSAFKGLLPVSAQHEVWIRTFFIGL